MKVCVAGEGAFGNKHLEALQAIDDVEVVALVGGVPETTEQVAAVLRFCHRNGVRIVPRGAGTSQCGQTVNTSVVVDCSKHLNHVLSLDVAGRRCVSSR